MSQAKPPKSSATSRKARKADGSLEEFVEILLPTLSRTFKVLVVDDDSDVLDLLSSYLEPCRIFDVTTVDSPRRARQLGQMRDWHCWIVDLFVPTVEDGLGLVNDFATAFPLISLSGKSTGAHGFQIGKLQAVDFLDKMSLSPVEFGSRVYRNCLCKLLFRGYPFPHRARPGTSLVGVLFDNPPDSVAEWADSLSVSPRALEQYCAEFSARSPADILSLFHIYRVAQRHYCSPPPESTTLSPRERTLVKRFVVEPTRLAHQVAAGSV